MGELMVTIPEKEYRLLKKCRKMVDSEFEERFTKKFIEDVRESEKAYERGEYVRCETSGERKRLFNSL